MSIAAAIASLIPLQLLSDWFMRRSVEVVEGSKWPVRAVCWGKIVRHSKRSEAPDLRFMYVRLPSWRIEADRWRIDRRLIWTRAHLVWIERVWPLGIQWLEE